MDYINKKSVKVTDGLLEELQTLMNVKHRNLTKFFGACIKKNHVSALWEFCAKESLDHVVQHSQLRFDSMLKMSLISDVCSGLQYLHASPVHVHGDLRATNVHIDCRWVAKISNFGLKRFRKGETPVCEDRTGLNFYEDLYWTAPENLPQVLEGEPPKASQAADMYSLAVILKQILNKSSAYHVEMHTMTAKEIIYKVAEGCDLLDQSSNTRGKIKQLRLIYANKKVFRNKQKQGGNSERNVTQDKKLKTENTRHRYFRPHICEEFDEHQMLMMTLVPLVRRCWVQSPDERPSAKQLLKRVKKLNPFR